MKKIIVLMLAAFVMFSATAAKPKGEIKEITFEAVIHCQNCVKKLQENISFEKGVKDLHICKEDQSVYIKYDASKTNEEILMKAITKLGVKVTGKSQKAHHHNSK